jgi:hypothetical protein
MPAKDASSCDSDKAVTNRQSPRNPEKQENCRTCYNAEQRDIHRRSGASQNYPAIERPSSELPVTTMKNKLGAVLVALLAVIFLIKPNANALDLRIDLGDRPYYEGPSYWDGGYEWVWVPGHREHDHWIHGSYERRGEFHGEHREHHHHHDHHDDDRH